MKIFQKFVKNVDFSLDFCNFSDFKVWVILYTQYHQRYLKFGTEKLKKYVSR